MRVARCECGRNGPEGDPAGRLVHGAGTEARHPKAGVFIYPRWGAGEHGTVHVVDIASGQDRVLPVDGMALGVVMESNRSDLSPDGSQILFDRYEADGDHWAVAPVAGGPPVSIGPEWPDRREGAFTEASWSPDGASVIAYYPTLSGRR